jgi:pantetheine-phosphate adenylyltransferase
MTDEKIAIYPLSADPMTLGHVDIVERAIKLFPSRKIHVVIANNRDKKHFFDFETRLAIAQSSLSHLAENIEIVSWSGIITDYANENNVDVMIRGIRDYTDFSYELNLEQFTRQTSKMETSYLTPKNEHINTSSSLIRMFLQTNNITKAATYMNKSGFHTMSSLMKSK